jgi:hypothetical protein
VNMIKTQSKLAKFTVAASFFALGCTVIGGEALALEVTAVAAPPENASSLPTTRWSVTYPVGYSDLDVSKLKGAAEVLCESAATWGKKEGDACVRKSVDDAVARVDVPLLTQYYELRSKGDKAGLVQLAKAD